MDFADFSILIMFRHTWSDQYLIYCSPKPYHTTCSNSTAVTSVNTAFLLMV